MESIRYVRGIGPKKAALFEKLGVLTLKDALSFYPRGYEDRRQAVPIASLEEGGKALIRAVAATAPYQGTVKGGMKITRLKVFDGSGAVMLTWFGRQYLASKLKVGESYLFFGRVQGVGAKREMVNPELESGEGGTLLGRILPVYPLTAGLTRLDVQKVIRAALDALPAEYPDFLPERLLKKYKLPNRRQALFDIHAPADFKKAARARKRLIFEELLLFCCGLERLKQGRRGETGLLFPDLSLERFYKAVPFALTGAQLRVIGECEADIKAGRPLNRLIQGDVGSGKTMVAAALCVLAAQNGYQAAVMAPTEILANQHYQTLAPLFDRLGISCALLTGSMTAANKRAQAARLASGEAAVAIGTHALIQETVTFLNLGMAVVDEQHRFGVLQRAALTAKGTAPHLAVMSATPIPRTLALILYGELDVSVIDELPPGRQAVKTYAVGEDMRARITAFLDKQCAQGGQAYVICPLVGESETGLERQNALGYCQALKKALPDRSIGLIHGRMPAAEKDDVMGRFAAGELDILVSTTVIEVGVNVPNATLMVIEDAGCFGLSQLHQLRGRVGRGERQSYCVLFGADKGEKVRERLKLLCRVSDGFELSRYDLELRGPGDFFGRRQHGLPELHIADLAGDMRVLDAARQSAQELLAESPDLTLFPLLKEKVLEMFQKEYGNIFN